MKENIEKNKKLDLDKVAGGQGSTSSSDSESQGVCGFGCGSKTKK